MAKTWRNRYDDDFDFGFEESGGRNDITMKLNSLKNEVNSNPDELEDEDYWEAKERELMR